MTYSSRNFLISGGDGSEERTPRFSNRLSSAMMSLQTSTHSSQMKTVGPAISLRTSFWSLLQNEQRRISDSPFFFIRAGPEGSSLSPRDYLVNDTILLGLRRIHDEVAVGIVGDLVHRLLGVEGQDVVAGIGQGEARARGSRGEEDRAERRRLPDADRLHVGPDELHRVIDRHPG